MDTSSECSLSAGSESWGGLRTHRGRFGPEAASGFTPLLAPQPSPKSCWSLGAPIRWHPLKKHALGQFGDREETCPPCCITLSFIWVQFFLQRLRAVVPAVLPPSPFPRLYLLTATFLLFFFKAMSFSLVSRSPRLSLVAQGASAVPAAGFLQASQPCRAARGLLLEGKRAEQPAG